MQRIQLIFTALLCLLTAGATAQTTPPSYTNRVSRLIYMGDSTVNGKRRMNTLNEKLTKLVLDGKLQAYSTFDSRFTEKKTALQMKYKLFPSDTVEIEDPVTNQVIRKIITSTVNYDDVRYIRVLEEWKFDAETGTSHIQIAGIAPVKDEYGDDGVFRGRVAMYWLRYADVQPILEQYEKEYPDQCFSAALWTNYFE